MGGRSSVWKYFTKDPSDFNRKARCNICNQTKSYATTVSNLKQHLRFKHPDFCPKEFIYTKKTKLTAKAKALWEFYNKLQGPHKTAKCKQCLKEISYKLNFWGLKVHLSKNHPNEYKQFEQKYPSRNYKRHRKSSESDTSDSSTTIDDKNDETLLQEQEKLNEIWKYFEQEGTKVRCAVCRHILADAGYEHLKAHLFERHPKLMLMLVQDEAERHETKSNAGSIEDNDNSYTEVVYLEQDSPNEDSVPTIENTKPMPTFSNIRAKNRKRNNSSNERLNLNKKDGDIVLESFRTEEDSELDSFVRYIKCLLKKLTPDAFSKVQVDILKCIMDAQYSSKVTGIDNRQSTSILSNIAAGNTSSVLSVRDIPDNPSLIGYTVTLAAKNDDIASKTDGNI